MEVNMSGCQCVTKSFVYRFVCASDGSLSQYIITWSHVQYVPILSFLAAATLRAEALPVSYPTSMCLMRPTEGRHIKHPLFHYDCGSLGALVQSCSVNAGTPVLVSLPIHPACLQSLSRPLQVDQHGLYNLTPLDSPSLQYDKAWRRLLQPLPLR